MGQILIYAGFASALIATIMYYMVFSGKTHLITKARLFFHGAVILTVSSAAYLFYLIFTHQFQFTYVWNYSSMDLPGHLLMSTFYAGQEGSFHLWAFFTAVLGIFLLTFISKRDAENKDSYEGPVMMIYSLVLTFLMFVLILKSPYEMVWETFPQDVQPGFVPPDGRGLNPLLQNFWMAIHPPTLFIGFTALTIPFAFAIAALLKNEYNKWLRLALPWTIFGAMILGLGIMLGGYWAYGVLGWGGYWGWDPVENSSLVPWVIIVAAIHSMINEKKTGRFKKTSLFLVIVSFAMVLYSTFLTRSGVLGDASVHSFSEPGSEVYLFLVVFLSLFTFLGIGLIIYRAKTLKSESSTVTELMSKESALFVGTVTLCAAALVIAVGTSWPILAKGTVDPAFYNKMNLPLAILIAVMNGLSILLRWKHSDEKSFFKSLYIPAGLAVVTTIVLVLIGLNDLLLGAFAAASLFSLFINLEIAYRVISKNKYKAGAYIAHLGVMVLFLGVIGSGKFSEEVNISLPLNQPTEALGYTMTYKGATQIPNESTEKYHFNVIVQKEDKAFLLQPVMYYASYNEGVMKNPDYANLMIKDVYVQPLSLEVPGEFEKSDITYIDKGSEVEINGMKVKFIDFDRSKFNNMEGEHSEEDGHNHMNIMGAKLEITKDGKTESVLVEQVVADQPQYMPTEIKSNENLMLYLADINVEGSAKIGLAVVDTTVPKDQVPETLVVTAAIKPFISLVWIGTLVMVGGFFLSMIYRYKGLLVRTNSKKHQEMDEISENVKIASNGNGNGNGQSKKKQKEKVLS